MKRNLMALISATLLFGACTADRSEEQVGDRQQPGIGYNGIGYNGIGYNGIGYNGIGYNGIGYNGLGWSGGSWTGWNYTHPDWGLDTWINHDDADGDGYITSADRELRLAGLAYWTGCACPTGTHPTWTGANPYGTPNPETRTFDGMFGLAPTWCTGAGTVPVDEQQAVTACLLGRVNTRNIHNILSMRGYEASLKLADNEKLFMAYPEGQLWGNMWDPNAEIFDASEGNYFKNLKAYACYFPWGNGNAQLAADLQKIIGRTCEWDGCGGHVHSSQACMQPGSVDGASSTGHDGLGNPVTTLDPAVGWSGLDNGPANGYQDAVTGTQYASWRSQTARRMSVFLGDWADLEPDNWKPAAYQCSDACPAMDGCGCYGKYCTQTEQGGQVLCETPSDCNNCATIVRDPGPKCGTSSACLPAGSCVRGRKLSALAVGCWLRVQFMRPFDLLTNSWVAGVANPHKSGTFLFRYSNGTKSAASILIRDRIRGSMIDGHGFAATAGWDDYQNNYIYPVYPGSSTFSGTTPGIDIEISADPASVVFPHLDYVQMFVGPPFGVPPREQYDDGLLGKSTIPEGKGYLSTYITVGADGFKSDFAQAHNVRVRVVTTHPNQGQLAVVLVHGNSSVAIQGTSLDADGWSSFNKSFFADNPSSGTWEVRVSDTVVDGVTGTLSGAVIEMQQ